jgi:hypothetical protein
MNILTDQFSLWERLSSRDGIKTKCYRGWKAAPTTNIFKTLN